MNGIRNSKQKTKTKIKNYIIEALGMSNSDTVQKSQKSNQIDTWCGENMRQHFEETRRDTQKLERSEKCDVTRGRMSSIISRGDSDTCK